jgi:cell division protein FtsL
MDISLIITVAFALFGMVYCIISVISKFYSLQQENKELRTVIKVLQLYVEKLKEENKKGKDDQNDKWRNDTESF